MIRLLIAMLLGAVLASGGVAIANHYLEQAANGTPSNASLYQYGNR
jgi:hypothetical protein